MFRKYNENFQRCEATDSLNRRTFLGHEMAINLINEHCQCGQADDNESLEYATPPLMQPQSPVLVENKIPLAVMPPVVQVGNTTFPVFEMGLMVLSF